MRDTRFRSACPTARAGGPSATFGPPDDAASAVHSLDWFARNTPHKLIFTHLRDGEEDAERMTFLELAEAAQGIASRLLQRCDPGDRAILVYDTGLDFIKAFVGCLYAGIVAVPAPTIDALRWNNTVQRLESIVASCQPRCVLTVSALDEQLGSIVSPATDMEVVRSDLVAAKRLGAMAPPDIAEDALAFLQYTSGSTGKPRGVMVSHGNLNHNFGHLIQFHPLDAVGVSWLPLHHDMGLIGAVLPALRSGGHVVLMSPEHFVERPGRWLAAISRYRAWMSGGPNFAYDLCLRKVSPLERDKLDLSCWTYAAVGAEVIRPKTLRRFADYFGPAGFSEKAFYPCYGLAECTLYVTGGHGVSTANASDPGMDASRLRGGGSPGPGNFLGCGRVIKGTGLKIVDPESGEERPDGEVGEIWVSGPSVTLGYWNNTAATAATFGHALQDSSSPTRYCRTGDLGFLRQGELFITGRLKELIIVNGRNIYPTDIENTVEAAHSRIVVNRAVAFAVDREEEERLVVVFEVRGTRALKLDEIMNDVRREILANHGVRPLALLVVRVGALPRTTSGKKQRLAVRDLYLSNALDLVGQWQDVEPSEPGNGAAGHALDLATSPLIGVATPSREQVITRLQQIIVALKGSHMQAIGPDTRLFADMGLASIEIMMIHDQIESELGFAVNIAELFTTLATLNERDLSLGDYASYIARSCPASRSSNGHHAS